MAGGAELEDQIGVAILELKISLDLKPQLRDLHINHDCKMEFNNKKAIVIYVPVPKQKASQKVHTRQVSRRRQNSPASTTCFWRTAHSAVTRTSRSTRACVR